MMATAYENSRADKVDPKKVRKPQKAGRAGPTVVKGAKKATAKPEPKKAAPKNKAYENSRAAKVDQSKVRKLTKGGRPGPTVRSPFRGPVGARGTGSGTAVGAGIALAGVAADRMGRLNQKFKSMQAEKTAQEAEIAPRNRVKEDVAKMPRATTSRRMEILASAKRSTEKVPDRMAALKARVGKSSGSQNKYMTDEEIRAWNRKNNKGYRD